MAISLAAASAQYLTSPFLVNPDSGNFTLAMWVKASSWNGNLSGSRVLAQQMDGGGTGRTWLQALTSAGSTSTQNLHTFISASNTTGATNINGRLGDWMLVGLTVPSGAANVAVALQLDGSADVTNSVNPTAVTSGTMRFGAHKVPSSTVDYWNGKLGPIAVWNTALSSSDWTALYNGGTGLQLDRVKAANLVGYWPLRDSVASGLSGGTALTAVNSPTFDSSDHPVPLPSLTDRLLSFWKMDEAGGNATDAHGSYTLSDTALVGSTSFGVVNGARTFNGTNQYLSNTNAICNGLSELSVSGWFHSTSSDISFDQPEIFSNYDILSGDGVRLHVDGDALPKATFLKSKSFSDKKAVSDSPIVADRWYHFVGTVGSTGTVKLYVNGTLQTTTDTQSGDLSISAETRVGARYDLAAACYMLGRLDEMGVWARELTQAEVTQLYGGGYGLAYPMLGRLLAHRRRFSA